jgi:hypothetical protein
MNLVRTKQDLGHLDYKECKDLQLQLVSGDHLAFQDANTSDVGKFAMSELPESAGMLLLVVRRESPTGKGAKFMSHAFTAAKDDPPDSAQVAVIDAFQGTAAHKMRIMEFQSNGTDQAEDLPLNSALSISPGAYKIELGNPPAVVQDSLAVTVDMSALAATTVLDTLANGSYVIMSVGGLEEDSSDFPQEIVVFPSFKSTASAMHGVFGAVVVLATLLARAL